MVRAYLRGLLNDEAGARKELARAQSELQKHFTREEATLQLLGIHCALAAHFGRQHEADSLLSLVAASMGQPLAPDTLEYFSMAGITAFFRGDFDSAVVCFQHAQGPHPTFSDLLWLGRALVGKRQVRDALGYLERASAICDRDRASEPPFSVLIHSYLALAYDKSGRTQDAIKEYRTFLDIWKDADPGIKEVADAKARLAALSS
jgi:tetratricopeptide (TPR) repeat protein